MPPASPKNSAPPLAKGTEVDLTIDKLAFGGKALGRVDGLVVFVEHAVPGQRVRVTITRKKSQFAEGRVVQLLEQSPAYTAPFCPHFGVCGGCQWQDLAYAEQLRWKGLQVQESLRHLAGLKPGDFPAPVASPEQIYYRNKMEFTFAPDPWLPEADRGLGRTPAAPCALGLHVGASFHRIFDLEDCFLLSTQTPALVREVRRWCRESRLPAYNTRTHQGFWRFLVLREGKRTGQTLAHLLTTDQSDQAAVESLAAHLRSVFPALTTMVHSRSRKKAQVASGEESRIFWGPGYIEEELNGLRFRISPQAFFQTNTAAAEGLYQTIIRLAGFTGMETVWDLYCGAGSIAISLASRVGRVVGFELVPEAVNDAYSNSRLNGLDNCRFLAGDLKDLIRQALRSPRDYPLPEVLITDPPRSGMHPQVVEAIKEIAPQLLLYVSCNPATLARDLALLQDQFATLTVQPFDLFPHTPHIESVTLLEKRGVIAGGQSRGGSTS
jgi:23S rRNA (uracil1939-C5)-methyltransferase